MVGWIFFHGSILRRRKRRAGSFCGKKIELEDRICVIKDNSGTGKTLAISMLKDSRQDIANNILFIDYSNYKEMLLLCRQFMGEDDVIICDNADLYIDDDFSSIVNISKAMFLIICKRVGKLKISGREGGFYFVRHTSDSLVVQKDRKF